MACCSLSNEFLYASGMRFFEALSALDRAFRASAGSLVINGKGGKEGVVLFSECAVEAIQRCR